MKTIHNSESLNQKPVKRYLGYVNGLRFLDWLGLINCVHILLYW